MILFFGWLIYYLGFSDNQVETIAHPDRSAEVVIEEDILEPVIDTDGDGIDDANDTCPTLPWKASNSGCPTDEDRDGMYDADDKCPDQVGIQENDGCPELKLEEEEKETLELAVKAVQFHTNKAKIRPTSYPILNDILDILNKYPSYNLHIQGHTDNQGTAAHYLQLSKDRAEACSEFFIAEGISANRLKYDGYGDTRPIAPNNTLDGRARNRRVQFELFVSI